MNEAYTDSETRAADIADVARTRIEARLEQAAEASLARTLVRFTAIAFGALLFVLFLRALPGRGMLDNVHEFKDFLATTGAWAPLVTVLIGGCAIAAGFPRTLFSLATGTLYGAIQGILLGHAAALLGAYLTFCAARLFHFGLFGRLGRRDGLRVFAVLDRTPGVLGVMMVRQLPFPGVAQNVALALTRIRHSVFLWGSLVGMLPMSILCSLIGAGLGGKDDAMALAPLISALLCALLGFVWLRKRLARSRNAESVPA